MAYDEQLGFPLAGMEAATPESSRAVRDALVELLERAKAARLEAPWNRDMQKRNRAFVIEKAKLLPPEEAEFLRRQFVLEFDRIELLLAA